ncbi:MAG TPA: class I SAM-dependent methyltransferase [Solirubrobacterales bacterium]|jgi:hypothetical protein
MAGHTVERLTARQRINRYLVPLLPHAIVRRHSRRVQRERHRLLHEATGSPAARSSEFTVADAIEFLVARGLPEDEVRWGSVPEPSLQWSAELLRSRLEGGRPLLALHIGNFVGVSLGFYTALLIEHHPDSVVVSIDPDITHRGIDQPQGHVIALLGRFGLLSNSIIIPGYTLEQNLGDTPGEHATETVLAERACEGVLRSLETANVGPFDLAVVDGNHEAAYLSRELELLTRLLRPGGLLVVDDVEVGAWDDVVEAFDAALASSPGTLREIGRDGRMGMLEVAAASPAAD